MNDVPFWRSKTLAEMTPSEWESICDGCGRCCLNKLEDEDTGQVFYTDVRCRLLDATACQCTDYKNRSKVVADCIQLSPDNVPDIKWLPPTCGYRLLARGRDLYWWHPLVSGDPDTVHAAGISVRGRTVISEEEVAIEDYEDRIVTWPIRVPRGKRRA
jgi:uncharacterized cysteine cluster protein YcgN (CxxCxxCC family)